MGSHVGMIGGQLKKKVWRGGRSPTGHPPVARWNGGGTDGQRKVTHSHLPVVLRWISLNHRQVSVLQFFLSPPHHPSSLPPFYTAGLRILRNRGGNTGAVIQPDPGSRQHQKEGDQLLIDSSIQQIHHQ